MEIKQFTFNHFLTNCYILADEATQQCAIVDPSMEASHEDAQLDQYIAEHHLTPVHILLTHAHVDHVAGLRHVCQRYNLPVTLHADGAKLLRQAEVYGSVMNFDVANMDDLATTFIEDDAMIAVGNSTIQARFVPGHCPGSMCYVIEEDQMVLTGDALFRMSIGRTDLPGGDYNLLMEKIRTRLLPLDDDYQVLPGHGDLSTIGDEKRYNSFFCFGQ